MPPAALAGVDAEVLARQLADAIGLTGRVSVAAVRRRTKALKTQRIALNQAAARLVDKTKGSASPGGTYIGSVIRGGDPDTRLWLKPAGLLVDGDEADPFDLASYDGPITRGSLDSPLTEKTLRRQFAAARYEGAIARAHRRERDALFRTLDGLWRKPGFKVLAAELVTPLRLGTSQSYDGYLYLTRTGFVIRDASGLPSLDEPLTREGFVEGAGRRPPVRIMSEQRDAQGRSHTLTAAEAMDVIASALSVR